MKTFKQFILEADETRKLLASRIYYIKFFIKDVEHYRKVRVRGKKFHIFVDNEGYAHNTSGPAVIQQGEQPKYFLHGWEYKKVDWEKILKNLSPENVKDVQSLGELF